MPPTCVYSMEKADLGVRMAVVQVADVPIWEFLGNGAVARALEGGLALAAVGGAHVEDAFVRNVEVPLSWQISICWRSRDHIP
jgi:hypothetical protein